ncbi:FAS1-like dehydratase domain-containing protein (plasmid) [Rhizobium leguminosarum]
MSEQKGLPNWIGRGETSAPETITPGLIAKFRASLEPHLANEIVPPLGLHWCLSPPAVAANQLGEDGHPKKGGFLPPIDLPRRMWAGGEVEFFDGLQERDQVVKASRITAIQEKVGRSGSLCFVTLSHDFSTPRGVAIRERQDIVYRDAVISMPPALTANARQNADHERAVAIDTVLLFRFSAMTFNGHRIHYDETYAREVEFYPGLVIHGPLQATLLLNFATTILGRPPRRFSFRGQSPACGPQTLRLRAWHTDSGFDLATVTQDNITAMTGSATWH